MKRLIALVFLALAACQSDPAPAPVDGPPVRDAAAEADCNARGGHYTTGGLAAHYICVLPTPDAGKSCSSGTDCAGICLADSRSCSPVTPYFGCHDVLTNNSQRATICID